MSVCKLPQTFVFNVRSKLERCLPDSSSRFDSNMVLYKYKLSTFGETKRLLGADDNLPEPILFREKLYVFDGEGKRIGRFSLAINQDEAGGENQKPLHVHISNRAFINGNLSESTVTGTVTHKLKTLEEIRYECTELPNSGKHERCLFLLRETTKYFLSVTNTICNFKSQSHATIPFADTLGLIGESANAVLMRKLARKGYEGILCLRTVLSNGKRCKNYYVTKLSEQVVNGKRMQVLIIYRNITNHRKYNLTMTLALTRAGQMIYLFWSNSKCFLHIDPDAEINTHCFANGNSRLHHHWHKDVQLHSLYLDKVDFLVMKNRSFKYQNEALRKILADFIEYLLITKPKDIICFAIQYFTIFGHNSIRKCLSKEMHSHDSFGNTYSTAGYHEKEGENLYQWPVEQGFFESTVMNSSVVLSLVLILWAVCTSCLPFTGSCDSCGRECQSACGTRGFRTCCLNYLKKRSTSISGEPELVMVLPELARYYSSLGLLIPDTGDRKVVSWKPQIPHLVSANSLHGQHVNYSFL